MSEATRGNVAQCNPIGIDFNQDNVPSFLITLSERHQVGKEHLVNVPQACLERNLTTITSPQCHCLQVCFYGCFN